MAYRYTMVDFNENKGSFELYCYEDDDVVWEDEFKTEVEALAYGNRFLNGEFKDGFESTV